LLTQASIRTKILFSFLILVMMMSLVFFASSYSRITDTMNKGILKHGSDITETFSQLVVPYVFESDYVEIQSIAKQLVTESDIGFIAIIDTNGRVWISTAKHPEGYFSGDPFFLNLFDTNQSGRRQVAENGSTSIEFASPIAALGKASYLVVTSISTHAVEMEAKARLRDIILILLAMIAFASILAVYLSRKLTQPLENLIDGTREIAQGNLDYRISVESSDEIGKLSKSFNTMSGQLEQELLDRKKAEQKLRHARDFLEITVEQRTHELADTIELLKQEMENREMISSELENKNAELERFAYTVSHDLKSPLVTITGFLGLLGKDIAANETDRIEEDIERVNSAVDTMRTLLDDLLELSRIGQVRGDLVTCNLSEIAKKALALVGHEVDEIGIEVVIDDMPEVKADATRLAEVYQNLFENAIKFMGEQKSPRVHIGAVEKDGMICCFVRDNGVGIAAEYHDQVFGLFERLSVDVDGTGVGLTLVKRIIEGHGGKIWVESEGLGRGSNFLFTLPM
jgi:signal transduction histidine kinase